MILLDIVPIDWGGFRSYADITLYPYILQSKSQ